MYNRSITCTNCGGPPYIEAKPEMITHTLQQFNLRSMDNFIVFFLVSG
uniref:Uncharacterized protein n=1 Tax=Aegilops tauschii subsp. strangulata TaxID=200361 RepID=A0A453GKR6_AEGTS